MSDDEQVELLREELGDIRRDLLEGLGAQRGAVEALGHEVGQVAYGAARIREDVTQLRNAVGTVHGAVAEVAASVSQLDRKFDEFTERYAKDQARAAAEAELTQLTLQWHSRFEQRRHTRTLARGLVYTLTRDALERGLVDAATVEACAQEQMLKEPSFWLAPAVVALAARHRGEPEKAGRAVGQAFSLDPARCRLFFALTCSRLGEQSDAASWMNSYLSFLDPYALDEDFPVVLDAIASDELGHEALGFAQVAMRRWAEQLDLAQSAAGSDGVARHVWGLRRRVPKNDYAALERCAPDWEQLVSGWELASVPGAVLSYVEDEFPEDPVLDDSPGGHTETALVSLIDRLDPQERAMDDRMRYLRLVIEHEGDREEALRRHQGHEAARGPADLRTLLVNSVFVPEAVDLGDAARLLVLRILWPGVLETVREYADQSRRMFPTALEVEVREWKALVPVDPAAVVDAEPLVTDLKERIHARTHQQVEAVGLRRFHLLTALLLTPVNAVLAILISAGATRVVCALVCFGCALWSGHEWRRVPLRKQELHQEGGRLARRSEALLRSGLKQRTAFFAEWSSGLRAVSDLTEWSTRTWGEEPGELETGEKTGTEA
ncbi:MULTISPECIES: hypothetical protein [unclassified Streptomyces]|uniref:hypothetical protein n=1 Tax=unclassified Streptomyces TaxID=2593676 RepID=UPI0036EA1758